MPAANLCSTSGASLSDRAVALQPGEVDRGVGRGGPGLKDDAGKLRYDLVPPAALRALADILTYGAAKYAPNGWRSVPDPLSRYTAALMRHLEAWRAGEQVDPESGRPHLAHVLCNAAFLVELGGDS